MPSVVFVINRALVRDPRGFGRRCRAAARDYGWEPVLAETSPGERGLGLARLAGAAATRHARDPVPLRPGQGRRDVAGAARQQHAAGLAGADRRGFVASIGRHQIGIGQDATVGHGLPQLVYRVAHPRWLLLRRLPPLSAGRAGWSSWPQATPSDAVTASCAPA